MAKSFTDHPEFFRVSRLVNNAMVDLADEIGGAGDALESFQLEVTTDRVADELTRLMLRAIDLKQRKAA